MSAGGNIYLRYRTECGVSHIGCADDDEDADALARRAQIVLY